MAQQLPQLPPIDTFYNSIDTFYNRLTDAQIQEFKQSTKGRWLNYLPSPGYSPFTGGFTLSLNLSAPIQEAKLKKQAAFKVESIRKANALLALSLKNEVFGDLNSLLLAINDFHSKDSLEYLTVQAFQLAKKQYDLRQMTPTDFFKAQMDHENFKILRIAEANAIKRSLLTLYIKAKCPIATNE